MCMCVHVYVYVCVFMQEKLELWWLYVTDKKKRQLICLPTKITGLMKNHMVGGCGFTTVLVGFRSVNRTLVMVCVEEVGTGHMTN